MNFSHADTDKLLRQLKEGDEVAYTSIFNLFYEKLCRYACSLTKDETKAEDLVQEQLMHLWLKRESLTVDSLSSYLYKSVYHKFIDLYKSEKKTSLFLEELQLEAIIEAEEEILQTQNTRLETVYGIIDQLPPKRKEIFILNKIRNYRYKEIALMKNISERTVESQIRKALISIRSEVVRLNVVKKLSVLLIVTSQFFL